MISKECNIHCYQSEELNIQREELRIGGRISLKSFNAILIQWDEQKKKLFSSHNANDGKRCINITIIVFWIKTINNKFDNFHTISYDYNISEVLFSHCPRFY